MGERSNLWRGGLFLALATAGMLAMPWVAEYAPDWVGKSWSDRTHLVMAMSGLACPRQARQNRRRGRRRSFDGGLASGAHGEPQLIQSQGGRQGWSVALGSLPGKPAFANRITWTAISCSGDGNGWVWAVSTGEAAAAAERLLSVSCP